MSLQFYLFAYYPHRQVLRSACIIWFFKDKLLHLTMKIRKLRILTITYKAQHNLPCLPPTHCLLLFSHLCVLLFLDQAIPSTLFLMFPLKNALYQTLHDPQTFTWFRYLPLVFLSQTARLSI